MNKQPDIPVISLSAELARPEDDERYKLAQRWQAALHRLALLRATLNETSYETEWLRIFDREQLMADVKHTSTLITLTALDVMETQHHQTMAVCDDSGIAYEHEKTSEFPLLIDAMRAT